MKLQGLDGSGSESLQSQVPPNPKNRLPLNRLVACSRTTSSLGTAAMIAYYWLPREEDIFQRFAWTDYRAAESPDHVLVWHHKNRKTEKVPVPLFDVDGTPLCRKWLRA